MPSKPKAPVSRPATRSTSPERKSRSEVRALRSDRKEATRHRIMMAALQLVEEGRTPGELGLREVARKAEMAAPSLYNHFADMDALGLALVDECLARLRAVMRTARQEMEDYAVEEALRLLLNKLPGYVKEYETMLRLLIQQWFNANPEYRRTIRREMSMMRQDLALNMVQSASSRGLAINDFSVESDAIFSLLITYILNVMDADERKRVERLALLEKQVLMIVLGGQMLKT